MKALKMAVFIGNRGFFPEKLIAGAGRRFRRR